MALTIKQIENVKPRICSKTGAAKNIKIRDSENLFLLVSPTAKKWQLRYAINGVEKNLSLGKYPTTGAREAREARSDYMKLVAQGIDPAIQRKQQKLELKILEQQNHGENNDCLLFKHVCEDWLQDIRKKWKDSTYEGERKRIDKDLIRCLVPQ